ncbi:hypothetical protein TNCV_3411211 [Trichonephila clavipes]|nr:hypothetical protein TNCV_3411211 [Trichonephila clavipes]
MTNSYNNTRKTPKYEAIEKDDVSSADSNNLSPRNLHADSSIPETKWFLSGLRRSLPQLHLRELTVAYNCRRSLLQTPCSLKCNLNLMIPYTSKIRLRRRRDDFPGPMILIQSIIEGTSVLYAEIK